jgi:hypothetical protein
MQAASGPVTVHLFLSHADEDRDAAQEVASKLSQEDAGISIYSSYSFHNVSETHANGHARRRLPQIEGVIRQADMFLALLTPDFLASASCRHEHAAALRWERTRQADGDETAFIRVLALSEISGAVPGPLGDRPWLSLSDPDALRTVIADLSRPAGGAANACAVRNGQGGRPGGHPAGAGRSRPDAVHAGGRDPGAAGSGQQASRAASSDGDGRPVGEQGFRNRKTELDQVLRDGLGKADGEHFWLVIAPPQMGKTWLLRRVGDLASQQMPGRWVVRGVDLRDWPDGAIPDARVLIGELFGRSGSPAGPVTGQHLAALADGLIETGKFHLGLLDSAELLDDATAAELRSYIAQIHAEVEAAGSASMRLALIVASRREPEWRGIIPPPRLRTLPLSEFGDDVVKEALTERAVRARRRLSRTELMQHAALIHQVSEGLPALLVKYLDWIEAGHWSALARLADQDIFDDVARPYAEEMLLSSASLLGHRGDLPDDQRTVIETALRALMPYRLLTQSHLSHHAEGAGSLRAAMDAIDWPVERVWAAVSGTALLFRPQENPWHRIDRPIRRLLVRYWYPDTGLLRQAHLEAGAFVRRLAAEPMGRDQAYMLVECLWHEANALAGSGQGGVRDSLARLAGMLSGGLKGSLALSTGSLRKCAVERLSEDAELAEILGTVDGWHDAVCQAILSPG